MTKSQELYQSSLDKGWKETKSYDINKLFFVAFFGGVIPLIVLGMRNAKWLQVPVKHLYPILAVGVLLIVGKFLLVLPTVEGSLPFDERGLKYGYKIGCVLLFLFLKYILNKPFQQHMFTEGGTEPLLKTAIIWTLIGAAIEFLVLAVVMAFQ